jgi:hypothetical protein
VRLPLFVEPAPTPSVSDMRERLGGRAPTSAHVGAFAQVEAREGQPQGRVGVVLHSSELAFELLVTPTRVVTVPHAHLLTDAEGEAQRPELARYAEALRRFALLAEGQRVRAADSGASAPLGTVEGTLVEKCKRGALVERADGSIVAVGFARLEPA